MAFQYIETDLTDGLASITLNRPPLNVLNIAMMEEINHQLSQWQERKEIKAVLFKARGKCFSAGVDVGEHMGDLATKMIKAFHGIFRLMEKLGAPTIASVYGSCLGGGCELAIFCDLVIASESAKFGQPEIQVGVFPPIAAQILPRTIGRKAAMEFILTGRMISAQEAHQMGLINKTVPDEQLDQATSEFVKPFLKLSAVVLRETRKAILAGLRDEFEPSLKIIEDIYLNELMKTADANEGLKAFLEKRTPEWKDQ